MSNSPTLIHPSKNTKNMQLRNSGGNPAKFRGRLPVHRLGKARKTKYKTGTRKIASINSPSLLGSFFYLILVCSLIPEFRHLG